MQFESISAFLDMGGYGFYVWLSYGVAALAILLLIVFSKQKHNQTVKHIAQRYLRETKRKEAAKLQQAAQEKNQKDKQAPLSPLAVSEEENEPTP
ncbi:heme exporter protein CcmD [Pseudocolwellia agarivorans]|uniref:heme exporter protein CcmD n=1 Tax=Pseudocolwellia agarivorans TaxID=1911682 RepID=UPI00098567A1|nr:heme exporter protein CcmD [Pseudocolwellia agarivorans]